MNYIFLMGPPPEGGESNPLLGLLPWVLIIFVFYFFMIRPQTKKAKEMKKFKASLEKGSRVITIGGIHGKIAELKETTVILEVDGGQRLKIERDAISMDSSTRLQEGQQQQK